MSDEPAKRGRRAASAPVEAASLKSDSPKKRGRKAVSAPVEAASLKSDSPKKRGRKAVSALVEAESLKSDSPKKRGRKTVSAPVEAASPKSDSPKKRGRKAVSAPVEAVSLKSDSPKKRGHKEIAKPLEDEAPVVPAKRGRGRPKGTKKEVVKPKAKGSNTMAAEKQQLESVESVLKKLPDADANAFAEIYYGKNVGPLEVTEETIAHARNQHAEVKAYTFGACPEQLRAARLVRVGVFQHQTPLPTHVPIEEMRAAMHKMAHDAITTAFYGHVNIFCFQETWNMPFAFCTREKQPWCEYAESASDGPTIKFLRELAKQYNMVIISPILERDEIHCDTIWNTAVVIDNHGDVLGKHRKNHIPRVGDFNESTYYFEGNTGHPVFETEFGRIAINICYGRHHPLNWLMFGINGAEIVFNPSATTNGLSEPLWGIEARNAAIANSYFTCAINRVGTETFQNEFTSANGLPAHKDFGHFYGSSYIASPNGSRTPGLSRVSNGLLIAEMDLNMCRQIKDMWGFQMTQRLDMYAKSLSAACAPGYERQIVRK